MNLTNLLIVSINIKYARIFCDKGNDSVHSDISLFFCYRLIQTFTFLKFKVEISKKQLIPYYYSQMYLINSNEIVLISNSTEWNCTQALDYYLVAC